MKFGIILAGGKGTRLNSTDRNKTSLSLKGKPLIQYGVDLYKKTVDKTVIVVGAFEDSVKQAIQSESVEFAYQKEQLGTGHAAKVAVEHILTLKDQPSHVFVGYGDHMMFYTSETLQRMIELQEEKQAVMTLVSIMHENPDELAWGRIIRNSNGSVEKVIEQKDATKEERLIKEQNAGFYYFDFEFLRSAIFSLTPSLVTGEYYITDLVEIAREKGYHVAALAIPFEEVGTGVNTREQLEQSEQMMS